MDKETLSNYGWIVICVLVLAVMIALATPFGSFIAGAVESTTEGLFGASQKAMSIAGLEVPNQTMEDVPTVNGATNGGGEATPDTNTPEEPEETMYIRGGYVWVSGVPSVKKIIPDSRCEISLDAEFAPNAEVFEDPSTFPTDVQNHDVYVKGDYVYVYNYRFVQGFWEATPVDGWSVLYRGSDAIPDEFEASINGKPIVSLAHTFEGTDIVSAEHLNIPSTVVDLHFTFASCYSLGGNITLNVNPTDTEGCFTLFGGGTAPAITIKGSCTNFNNMLFTGDGLGYREIYDANNNLLF